MGIHYLKEINSTQTYLKDYIKNNGYSNAYLVYTNNQTDGIGSRNNKWIGVKGNLFFSYVIDIKQLPSDLPIQSASIYFSFIFKEILKKYGSDIWLKWPNDFYIENKKIGGTITNMANNLLFCGIGLNLKYVQKDFGFLDIKFQDIFLNEFFDSILEKKTWKQIFSKFLIEFEKSKNMKTTIDNNKILLDRAKLNLDGSILINSKKVYSLR
ncbi:MAG: biotin--[acetyl-CoA-carboxylase] ligase [Campylobacterota bacterium]|nr:biotin--[acetyl-CoA-carboxylase] ligase [Campylobacterota bacterium]